MSLPQRSRCAENSAPLSWVLNKLCRHTVCHKIMGFSSVTIIIPKSNFFFFSQPQRLSTRGDWQNHPAQGAELQSQQTAVKELLSATSKNQPDDLMKTFKTSSDHSETSEICIKAGFFTNLNACAWIHVAPSGRLLSKDLEEQESTFGSRGAQGELTSAFKCLALARAIKILRSKCTHIK